MELEKVKDKIGFIIVLIANLKLTKGTSLGLGCSCITRVILKALKSSIKL